METSWQDQEREWKDPSNWRGGPLGLYVAPRDPRILVRKRTPYFGWTFNFAHQASWLIIGGFGALTLIVVAIAAWGQ